MGIPAAGSEMSMNLLNMSMQVLDAQHATPAAVFTQDGLQASQENIANIISIQNKPEKIERQASTRGVISLAGAKKAEDRDGAADPSSFIKLGIPENDGGNAQNNGDPGEKVERINLIEDDEQMMVTLDERHHEKAPEDNDE